MNKKATAGIVAGVLACSLTAGGLSLIGGADAEVVGKNNPDWVSYGGAVCTYAEDGYTNVTGNLTWGTRGADKNSYKFDGLTIEMDFTVTDTEKQDIVYGFALGKSTEIYFGDKSSFAVTHRQKLFGDSSSGYQNRLFVGSNHAADQGPSIAYTDEALTNRGFGLDKTMVMNAVAHSHYTFTFESHSDTAYKMTITMPKDLNALWEANANYTADDTNASVVTYLSKEAMADNLDENGNTHVAICGFRDDSVGSYSINVKISDDNTREYFATDVAPAEAKVTAYEQAEITDDASFTAAMEKREAALAAVSSLKAREKAELTERITAVDEGYKTNETVQTSVTGLVQDKIDEARNAFGAIFADESTLTEASIGAANDKVKAAKREYADKKAMLSEDNAATLEDGIGNIEYYSRKMSVLEWIVGYEKAIEDLDVTADTIGADIAAVKAAKAAFVGSDTETALNGLADADKTTYATRITAADSALASKEEDAAEAVKTAYVVAFEETLEDLSSYSKIEAAFEQKGVLESSITLTTDDGELFTRYTAGVEKLYTALETFVSDAITSVSTALDGKFETLASFSDVRSDYNDITLELLGEDRAATATITSAYDALTEKLKANIWYDFAQTNLSKVERNEKGIYFEQTPEFPSRINYNKKLDLTEGTEVVVELTQMAYYNGDLTEGGASKGANNLSINFSNAPNSYKSMSQGINIIIWLFEVESNVQIMSPTDNVMANGTLATPLNGGKLTITVKHGVYEDFVAEESYPAYIITLNEVEIVLSDDIAAANGLAVNDEVYFSMGSFADYKADPNCFTLVSVDDAQFAAKSDKPDPDPDPDPKPTPDPKPDDNNNVGLIVGLSVAGGVIVLAAVAVAVVFVLKKKKSAAGGGENSENSENKQDEE